MRSCLGCLVLLFVGVPVLAVLSYGLDALLLAPWAYPAFGRPTLTGAWVSEFTVPGGTHFGLLLKLRHPFLTNTQPEPPGLTGAANVVEINHRSADFPQPGLQPAYLRGSWQADTLRLDSQMIRYDPEKKALVASTGDLDVEAPIAIELKESDDASFQAVCARLTGGAD